MHCAIRSPLPRGKALTGSEIPHTFAKDLGLYVLAVLSALADLELWADLMKG